MGINRVSYADIEYSCGDYENIPIFDINLFLNVCTNKFSSTSLESGIILMKEIL